MNNKDLVSFELAKKLKACGFDEPCQHYYDTEDAPVGHYWRKVISISRNYNEDILKFSAPTLYAAQKWLREKHKLHLLVDSDLYGKWCPKVVPIEECRINEGNSNYITYEQALSASINSVLDLLAGKEGEV